MSKTPYGAPEGPNHELIFHHLRKAVEELHFTVKEMLLRQVAQYKAYHEPARTTYVEVIEIEAQRSEGPTR